MKTIWRSLSLFLVFFVADSFCYSEHTRNWHRKFTQEAYGANNCNQVVRLLMSLITEAEINQEISQHLDDIAIASVSNMGEQEFLKIYGKKYLPYIRLCQYLTKNHCERYSELTSDIEIIEQALLKRKNRAIKTQGSL